MSNKTKDILDEILDVEESTAELVEKKPNTLQLKEMIPLKMLILIINIRERTFII